MQQMALLVLIDQHFPTHRNWKELSPGWVCTIWLSSILSRGDRRLVHVESWGEPTPDVAIPDWAIR